MVPSVRFDLRFASCRRRRTPATLALAWRLASRRGFLASSHDRDGCNDGRRSSEQSRLFVRRPSRSRLPCRFPKLRPPTLRPGTASTRSRSWLVQRTGPAWRPVILRDSTPRPMDSARAARRKCIARMVSGPPPSNPTVAATGSVHLGWVVLDASQRVPVGLHDARTHRPSNGLRPDPMFATRPKPTEHLPASCTPTS